MTVQMRRCQLSCKSSHESRYKLDEVGRRDEQDAKKVPRILPLSALSRQEIFNAETVSS